MSIGPHLLLIDARFYEPIADELCAGAVAALAEAGASHDRLSVPGVLEIPAALAMVLESSGSLYDGYVVLGCVIRGETSHYDIVAVQSARAIVDLTVGHALAVGNGILTVESKEQATVRAKLGGKDKGGVAARAALAMIELRRSLRSQPGDRS